MKNPLFKRSLTSIEDFSKEEILLLLQKAKELKIKPTPNVLKGKILATCFFEPSTRTKLSFETAMLRLGGQCIGFSDPSSTSVKKGESLSDMIQIISHCSDLIALRHPLEGSALFASEVTSTPVINAGDGANQHPTQTLLDLFTIKECQTQLDDLHIAIIGDLKYGRAAHSLALALSHFRARLYFISPTSLFMPDEILQILKRKSIRFSFHQKIEDVLSKCDILYMTRIQKERLISVYEKDSCSQNTHLKKSMLKDCKPSLRILHPLPRVDEIDPSIDSTPYAYYFEQAKNSIFVRQALLSLILKEENHAENTLCSSHQKRDCDRSHSSEPSSKDHALSESFEECTESNLRA